MAEQKSLGLTACPVCGELAELRPKYLGGYGYHIVAFCRTDDDHQTPVLRVKGAWRAAKYLYPPKHEYRIVLNLRR